MSFATMQEAFNETVKLLAAQGERASSGTGVCYYKKVDRLTAKVTYCGVGINLITRMKTSPDISACAGSVNELEHQFPEVKEDLQIDGMSWAASRAFWTDIQNAHDNYTTVEQVKSAFTYIASRYELKPDLVSLFVTWK